MELKEKTKVLINEFDLDSRIKELAEEINQNYDELDIIVLLKGGLPFASDLVKRLKCNVRMHYMIASSYLGRKESRGYIELNHGTLRGGKFDETLLDKNVLLIDDIYDTGRTLNYVHNILKEYKPKSVEFCVLLKKRKSHQFNLDIRYYGFEIPNKFVYGYGLDKGELYRDLPYILVEE